MPPWILRCSPTGAERRIFLSTHRPDKGNELKCRNDKVRWGEVGWGGMCAPLAETYLRASQSRVSPRTPHGLAADVCEVWGECWAQPDRMQMLRAAMRDWLIVKVLLGEAVTAALVHMLHFTALKECVHPTYTCTLGLESQGDFWCGVDRWQKNACLKSCHTFTVSKSGHVEIVTIQMRLLHIICLSSVIFCQPHVAANSKCLFFIKSSLLSVCFSWFIENIKCILYLFNYPNYPI